MSLLVWLGLRKPPCIHFWRPAQTSKGPARWCEECETTEHLTPAGFYAQFGERFYPAIGNTYVRKVDR